MLPFKKIFEKFQNRNHKEKTERVYVAAFGKHLGWADHIDDLGLDTELLVSVKRSIYVQGIRSNIDSGAWAELEQTQRIDSFDHVFIWCMGSTTVLGCIWSSEDGKGRKSYPMIVCVECDNLPLEWVLENILSDLYKIRDDCKAADSADKVQEILFDARKKFRQAAHDVPLSEEILGEHTDVLPKIAHLFETKDSEEGLLRILYQVDREVARSNSSENTASYCSSIIRVPGGKGNIIDDAVIWCAYMLEKFGVETPVLVVIPPGKKWLDIIVGEEIGESQIFCLKASPRAIPLTNNVPYNIDPLHREQYLFLLTKKDSSTPHT